MNKLANTAFILSLIGGIIGTVTAIILFIGSIVVMFAGKAGINTLFPPILYIIVASYTLLTGIAVIIGSILIKNPKYCLTGSILVTVFSFVGAGTIFGMIGGIMGIVASQK